jgi:hypothetical protein
MLNVLIYTVPGLDERRTTNACMTGKKQPVLAELTSIAI